jgi:hypothetical protein
VKISLSKAGNSVRALGAGLYTVVVNDRSSDDNFHLVGPGVDRSTGVKSMGSVTWRVRLRIGRYRYRSDARSALSGTFRVRR